MRHLRVRNTLRQHSAKRRLRSSMQVSQIIPRNSAGPCCLTMKLRRATVYALLLERSIGHFRVRTEGARICQPCLMIASGAFKVYLTCSSVLKQLEYHGEQEPCTRGKVQRRNMQKGNPTLRNRVLQYYIETHKQVQDTSTFPMETCPYPETISLHASPDRQIRRSLGLIPCPAAEKSSTLALCNSLSSLMRFSALS